MPRVKYLSKRLYANQLSELPSFHHSGSVKGMKDKFYGKDALLVKSGNFIYNVSTKPELYIKAK